MEENKNSKQETKHFNEYSTLRRVGRVALIILIAVTAISLLYEMIFQNPIARNRAFQHLDEITRVQRSYADVDEIFIHHDGYILRFCQTETPDIFETAHRLANPFSTGLSGSPPMEFVNTADVLARIYYFMGSDELLTVDIFYVPSDTIFDERYRFFINRHTSQSNNRFGSHNALIVVNIGRFPTVFYSNRFDINAIKTLLH